MSKVIVFASGKGGTGKSTVCVGIAISLVKKNNKVLLIDCDCGLRGLDLLLGIEDKLVFDISDAVSGNCNYSSAVYEHETFKGLSLLPAPLNADDEISPNIMKQIVSELSGGYDYILIDAPAGVGTSLLSAAAPADTAFLVVNPEPVSLRACEIVKSRLETAGTLDMRLIINKLNIEKFTILGAYKDLDEVIDAIGVRLIGVVPECGEFANMLQLGCSIYRTTEAEPVFDCIASRIEGENVPIALKI